MTLREQAPRFATAVLLSAATCAVLYATAITGVEASHGRFPRLDILFGFAFLAAAIVGFAGAIVQWPILRAMRSLNRPLVVLTGSLLAFVPLTISILLFSDPPDDPATLSGYVRFWLRVPGEFLLWFVPMAFAGAVLALFATAPARNAA